MTDSVRVSVSSSGDGSVAEEERYNLLTHRSKTELPEKYENTASTEDVKFWSWKGPASVDQRFFVRLWRLLRIVRASPALILPVLAIVNTHVVAKTGEVTGRFYNVFVNNRPSEFRSVAVNALFIFMITTVVTTLITFLADLFGFLWRKRLTMHVMEQYTRNQKFHWLKNVDNPDQRLESDLQHWSLSLAEILKDVASVPYDVLYYTSRVYRYMHSFTIIAVVYVWFIAWALLLKLLIAPSANLIFAQEVKEGNFRSALMRLKRYRTEIAASQAEELRITIWKSIILFVTKGQDYLGTLLNYILIGTLVFSGRFSSSTSGEVAQQISNVSFHLLMLVYSFSRIPDTSKKITQLAGLTPRISQLIEQLDTVETGHIRHNDKRSGTEGKSFRRIDAGGIALELENFSCWTPGSKIIIRDLNLSLEKGKSLLIIGPSGVGKSTLLLLLMELYDSYEGNVKILPTTEVMMLPQQSVIAPGKSLKEQLSYPQMRPSLSDEETLQLLAKVDLEKAVDSWCDGDVNQERKWSHVFSAGELQRIALARALHCRPTLLLLDESSSAIPRDLEGYIYGALKAKGITIITVAHHAALETHHDFVLKIEGDAKGDWTLTQTSPPR